MSEPENKDKPEKPDASKMAAFSDKRDDLFDALDMLYIYGNASGRNKFREKWPDVASYVFDEQLIKFDDEGVTDIDLRKTLEEEADARRFFLKETIEEMVEKSVDAGVLKFDYVGKVVDAFGPLLSTYLYSETVIERVRPGVLKDGVAKPDEIENASGTIVSDEEKQALSDQDASDSDVSTPEEALDEVKPIETSPDKVSDDLSEVADVSLEDAALDDLIPPTDQQDDISGVRDVDDNLVDSLLAEENTQQSSEQDDDAENPAPASEKDATNLEQPDEYVSSNPAPPIGGSLEPPPSAEVVAEAEAKAERDKLPEKPEETAKPWDKPKKKEAIKQSNPAPSVVASEADDQPVSQSSEAKALLDAVRSTPDVSVSEVEQPSGSQSEQSEEQQPQPDEVSPQSEGLPGEASQSQEQPVDKKTEQLEESTIDSVSFAGRE